MALLLNIFGGGCFAVESSGFFRGIECGAVTPLCSFLEEGEEFLEFLRVGAAAVFADLKGFGALDGGGFVLAVELGQLGAETLGDALRAFFKTGAHVAMPLLLFGRVAGDQLGVAVGAAFVELRFEGVEGVELFLDDRVDGDGDVRLEGVGFLEGIRVVEEDGIVLEIGHVRAKEGDGDHVGGVLDEDAGVAVVGMIVVGARGDDHVGFPFTDEPGDEPAVLEGGQQLAVVDVEDLGGDAQDLVGLLGLGFAAVGQGSPGLPPVADVAVGNGDQLHVMSFGGPEGGDAADLDFAIIRVGAKDDDAEFAVIRRGGRGGGQQERAGG